MFSYLRQVKIKTEGVYMIYLAFLEGIPEAAASPAAIKPEALSKFEGFRPKP